MINSRMIEFINTNKNQKTIIKLDKLTLSEDSIKIRHELCHLHRIRNGIEACF